MLMKKKVNSNNNSEEIEEIEDQIKELQEKILKLKKEFPMFEFSGPPCKAPGCNGVLIHHLTKDLMSSCGYKCTICKKVYEHP